MTIKQNTSSKGFTLLEVLLVLTLVGILLAITLVTFDPVGQVSQARNNQRKADILKIESAITQYRIQEGTYPVGLTRTYQEICDPSASSCTGYVDLSSLVPRYLESIPQDPNDEDSVDGSGYSIAVDENSNRVSIRSLRAEASETIAVNDPLPAEIATPEVSISYDSDVQTMLNTRAALGDPTPTSYAQAINDYVIALKETPGMWNTITQLVVFAGATTVQSAMVPIKGVTPTSVNFVNSDLNIKTGLIGDGSTKYLNTGYAAAIPSTAQDNMHIYVLVTNEPTVVATTLAGRGGLVNGAWVMNYAGATRAHNGTANSGGGAGLGGYGLNRSVSGSYQRMAGNIINTITQASQAPNLRPMFVFARSNSGGTGPENYSNGRILIWAVGSATTLNNYIAPGNDLQAALNAI